MSNETVAAGNKLLGLALLAIGIVLLVFGFIESDSVSSSFSRLFTGQPTDKTVWLLIGGAVLTIGGLADLARNSR